jgi:glycosyltransferase involved in cell wall biosynthesis
MKTLSIVIPVYNEEKTIRILLGRVEEVCLEGITKEIIIVDDFSTDGTRDVLKKLNESGKYTIIFQDKNYGKGAALRTGFAVATGDFCLIQDADLEYDPTDYAYLLSPLIAGKADAVYGSRFVGDKAHRVLFFWHSIGNKFLTLLSNIFTNLNLTDMETCYKAFTRETLLSIEPEITAVLAEHNFRIYEVGISYAGRTYGEGKKINWKDGISAIWTIIKTWYRYTSVGRDTYKSVLFSIAFCVLLLSLVLFKPNMLGGDSQTYVESLSVIKTGIVPSDFIPNRILTTSLGLLSILSLDIVIQNIAVSWMFINIVLLLILVIYFYNLILELFNDKKVAFIGGLLLCTNYSFINFGPAYLMDAGGWALYVIALYYLYKYIKSAKRIPLWSALLIAIGGLWKEYVFLASVVLAGAIVIKYWGSWNRICRYVLLCAAVILLPTLILNLFVYYKYHYSYFSWFKHQDIYTYSSRIVEYIKAFGSLYNFGWFLFLPGLFVFMKKSIRSVNKNEYSIQVVYILLILVSTIPFLIWPAITQRILFITIPGIILVSLFAIRYFKYDQYYTWGILSLYTISNFIMNSVLLKVINF